MSVSRYFTYAALGLTVLAAGAMATMYACQNARWKGAVKSAMFVAERVHKELMKGSGYRNTDLGNRINWIKPLLDGPLTELSKELDDDLRQRLKKYIHTQLPLICVIEN